MSYNVGTAKEPLTGEDYDILILQEREQQHMICNGEMAGFYILPLDEYIELRDMYKKLVEERDGKPSYGDGPGDMTIEQAIAILEPETTSTAQYEYKYYGGLQGKEAVATAFREACRIAAAVMRKEVSRRRAECERAKCKVSAKYTNGHNGKTAKKTKNRRV